SQVSSERTSETAALMNTSQNLGSSLGTALMGAILLAGLASGDIALIDESKILPDSIKDNLTAAVEENVRFLSNEQMENILKNTPPDISQEILRINEIARIDGIKRSLWGMILISILGIFATFSYLRNFWYLHNKKTGRDKLQKNMVEFQNEILSLKVFL
ncbi:MAG: hypothetical protein WCB90_08735, partial [Methanosarcina sp.]